MIVVADDLHISMIPYHCPAIRLISMYVNAESRAVMDETGRTLRASNPLSMIRDPGVARVVKALWGIDLPVATDSPPFRLRGGDMIYVIEKNPHVPIPDRELLREEAERLGITVWLIQL